MEGGQARAGHLRIILDTSAFLDLFGKWSDDHKERRGDLVKEVHILAPLRPYLFSTQAIQVEVHRLMAIGVELEKYVDFKAVGEPEISILLGFVFAREADYSLLALARRFERAGDKVFLITKDRTFSRDLLRLGLRAEVVPPTGMSEAITVLAPGGTTIAIFAHRIQNNAFANLSRAMQAVRHADGEAAYLEWQEFLDSRTPAKYELVEALRATGVAL